MAKHYLHIPFGNCQRRAFAWDIAAPSATACTYDMVRSLCRSCRDRYRLIDLATDCFCQYTLFDILHQTLRSGSICNVSKRRSAVGSALVQSSSVLSANCDSLDCLPTCFAAGLLTAGLQGRVRMTVRLQERSPLFSRFCSVSMTFASFGIAFEDCGKQHSTPLHAQ